jgi:hypothetical protein
MVYIALRFEVFLRPTKLPPPVFKWVDLLPAVTDDCVLVDFVFDISPSLLRGSGTGGEGEFVFL